MVSAGIEKNMSSPSVFGEKLKGDKSDGCYFDDYCNWTRIPEFQKFIFESPAAAVAGTLMKSEVCSIWMPVDPVSRETCVQFVAGSHKWAWYFPRKFATTLPYEIEEKFLDKEYEPVPDVDANRHKWNILSWDLQV
ncbi:uncharacterized protein LOC129223119 [Uloborus diversus]|uniref:uncharacterized protein LOC129223119 n=1 Tax=Uloborus diversus TaxID=327109 RepID=UPI00240908DC|nr:uncharacterized protein LOC129223119 [Uloborus diversus]